MNRRDHVGDREVRPDEFLSPEQAAADDTVDDAEQLEPTTEERYYNDPPPDREGDR